MGNLPEILETETSQQYNAFVQYLLMGTNRSLRNLSQLHKDDGTKGFAIATLGDWSAKNHWVERCREYDAQLQQELESEVRERKLSLLNKYGILLEEALNNTDISNVQLSQLTQGIRVYVQSAMETLNELPTNKTLVGNLDLNSLSFEDLIANYGQSKT